MLSRMSLALVIGLLQVAFALPTLIQALTELGSAISVEAKQMSRRSALVSSASPAGTQRVNSQQSGQAASPSIDARSHLSHDLPIRSAQRTGPSLEPSASLTMLTVIRDNYNWSTGYLCAPTAATTSTANPSPSKRTTGASCTYNGRTYEPGATIRVPGPWCSGCVVSLLVVVTCTNGQWLTARGAIMPQ